MGVFWRSWATFHMSHVFTLLSTSMHNLRQNASYDFVLDPLSVFSRQFLKWNLKKLVFCPFRLPLKHFWCLTQDFETLFYISCDVQIRLNVRKVKKLKHCVRELISRVDFLKSDGLKVGPKAMMILGPSS